MNLIQQYYDQLETDILFINTLADGRQFLVTEAEALNIMHAVYMTRGLDGSIAEAGVYEGCSAKLIGTIKQNKKLFLFDTFEGLPYHSATNNDHESGNFKSNLQDVTDYLSTIEDVFIYKGIFPQETGNMISNEQFSFVHLDVDLYKSTYDALEFFYPRMVTSGVILIHDYISLRDVRKSVEDFLQDKKENLFPLYRHENTGFCGTQCMIVKA